MKNLIIAFIVIFCHTIVYSQIKPNTVYCIKGSDAHQVSYCGDLTPCKTKTGPNGSHTVCLAGTPNPPAGALISSSSCWSMVTEYTCLQYNSACAPYTDNKDCTEQGTRECTRGADSQLMLANNPKLGECTSYTRSFSCLDKSKPSTSSTTYQTSCDTNSTMNGLDWSTNSPSASQDFVLAATSQEFARELAVYGAKNGAIIGGLFPGISQDCRGGWLGLKTCCDASGGGAVTNRTVASKMTGEVGSAAATYAWQEGSTYAIKAGSQYVYDTVYSSVSQFMTDGMEAMLSNGALTGSFSNAAAVNAVQAGLASSASEAATSAAADAAAAAGVAAANATAAQAASIAAGTAEAAAAAAAAATQAATAAAASVAAGAAAQTAATTAASTAAAGVAGGVGAFGFGTTASSAAGMFATTGSSVELMQGLYFNPYALAIAIVIMIIMEAMSCSPEEKQLANAKTENLCHYIGSYCSGKSIFGCYETKQSYCCYNGLLGKAVEEGAHAQLGLSWGSPESPACGGLSPDQITSLDFSTPAMQEALKPFQNQIMENFNKNAGAALSSGVIQTTAQNTAVANAAALCLQRQKLDPKTVCN